MRIDNNSQTTFNGYLNNKYLLKTLESIAEHGASFSATTSFVMAVGVRPFAINHTPGVEKENKQYASSSSLASALIKLGIVEAIALPVENAVKKIDKTPKTLLSNEAYKFYKGNKHSIINSAKYRFGTQVIKLGTNLLTAVPKSLLTVALIPVLMDKIYNNSRDNLTSDKNKLSFKGGNNFFVKTILKILNNPKFQQFSEKFQNVEPDLAKHMSATTDALLSGSYALATLNNKKIQEDRKLPLVYNSLISTGITILGGYPLDNFLKKRTQGFIAKFAEANKNSPKLAKYLEGINIIRPALVFAGIYYVLLPMLSTFLAEKTDKALR